MRHIGRVAVAALATLAAKLAAAAEGPASAPAAIPFRNDAALALAPGRLGLALVLALVLAMVALAWWRWRRPAAGTALRRRLKLVETLRISPRSTLLLVELGGRSVLMAEQAGSLVLLVDGAAAAVTSPPNTPAPAPGPALHG